VRDFGVAAIELVKYEGAGNDFLVLFDPMRSLPFDADLVSALCDRHRGVGADGVLRLSDPAGVATVAMTLKNADGSAAETSGNGLRCAALAAVHAGLAASEVVIETVVGSSKAVVRSASDGRADVSVEMGRMRVEPVASPIEGRTAYRVDAGNPHLVLVGATLDDVDLNRVGPELEVAVPDGQNVEVVAVSRDRGRIALRVWERGAGITEACGSGSAAAAASCRFADLVENRVVVENPGGELVVELSGSQPAGLLATLTGPARRVAVVGVDLDELYEKSCR
jgi:diaminopimelate epimerase